MKEELRQLALAEFAADLHEVTLAAGRRPVFEDPANFFALTCPTLALRELVKDVAARLAGRSDKAVRTAAGWLLAHERRPVKAGRGEARQFRTTADDPLDYSLV